MPIKFYKFSTAGNTTLFTENECNFQRALKIIPAEQAGVADVRNHTLRMAGNELCINATLAFGALLAFTGHAPGNVQTSGLNLKVISIGVTPAWTSRLEAVPAPVIENLGSYHIARLPGIIHILMPCAEFPEPADAMKQAMILIRELKLDKEPAAGVVWHIDGENTSRILPVVHVPSIQTTFMEMACGSASLSAAMALGNGKHSVGQLSGEDITVTKQDDRLSIEAPVHLLAQGEIWPEMAAS